MLQINLRTPWFPTVKLDLMLAEHSQQERVPKVMALESDVEK